MALREIPTTKTVTVGPGYLPVRRDDGTWVDNRQDQDVASGRLFDRVKVYSLVDGEAWFFCPEGVTTDDLLAAMNALPKQAP
jgi:hypothetical protein